MKLKNVAGICKKAKTIIVYEKINKETGEIRQYVGDGVAIYPVFELPHLEKESLMAIFDIPEKQRDDIRFEKMELPVIYDMSEFTPGETICKAGSMLLITGGKTWKPLYTGNGIVFIDVQYIRPMADVMDVLEYYARETLGGICYIVAKAGYLPQALIKPIMVTGDKFIQELENMAVLCRETLDLAEAKRAAEEESEPEQTAFDTRWKAEKGEETQ